mmetsp:Transcript_32887/g.115492  ORF Transcript_32887/g.115492 Transcript_32887/m.115492 type:complete len:225 (+) Transcript_32887:314-988(+)
MRSSAVCCVVSTRAVISSAALASRWLLARSNFARSATRRSAARRSLVSVDSRLDVDDRRGTGGASKHGPCRYIRHASTSSASPSRPRWPTMFFAVLYSCSGDETQLGSKKPKNLKRSDGKCVAIGACFPCDLIFLPTLTRYSSAPVVATPMLCAGKRRGEPKSSIVRGAPPATSHCCKAATNAGDTVAAPSWPVMPSTWRSTFEGPTPSARPSSAAIATAEPPK